MSGMSSRLNILLYRDASSHHEPNWIVIMLLMPLR